jgi:hypothetical protein
MTDLTIRAGQPRIQYAGDGVQTAFAFPFPVFAATDIAVWLGDGDDPGAFTVSGAGAADGGAVTFAAPPGEGVRITILRVMPLARGAAFQDGGEFRAATLNGELDRLAMLVQQVDEAASRSLRLAPQAAAAATELPPPAPGFLRWNSDGSGLVYDPVPQALVDEVVQVRDSVQELLDTATSAATAAQDAAAGAAASALAATTSATALSTSASAAAASATAATIAASQASGYATTINMPAERRRRDLAHMRERVRPLVDPATASQPCLGIDFVQGVGTDFMAFARATTATCFDAAGVLRTVAIDAPRYDHDPASGAPRGLLLETQRSNLLLRSAEFDSTAWMVTGVTVTANAAPSPDGLVAADRLAEVAVTSAHGVAQAFSAQAVAHTVSVFARALTRKDLVIEVSRAGAGDATARFDLATGAVAATSGTFFATARMEAAGGGWYRCSVTTLPLTAAAWQAVFRLWSAADSYAGDTTRTLLLWGAQAEAGTHPSSYIATAGATVTRAADVAQVSLASLGVNAADWAVMLHAAAAVVAPAGTNFAMLSLNSGNAYGNVTLQAQNTGRPTLNVIDSTLMASLEATIAYAPFVPWRAAFRCRTDDFALVAAGGAVLADNAGSVPATDRLMLGRQPNGQDLERGWLRSVLMFPRGISNAALQALTA